MKKKAAFTAVIRRSGKWWIGWLEEIQGVNAQARSKPELIRDLRSALKEALEMNREEALSAAGKQFEEVSVDL
jgi:predicted RNase H-like HicB family nuclease